MVERTSLDALSDSTKHPIFTENPRTVRVALDPGAEIDEHSHPETDIVFFVVDGEMELRLDDETYELTGGDVLQFEGERTIAGTAESTTTALVVLAERP